MEKLTLLLVGCLGTLVAAAHGSQDRSTVDLAPPNPYIDKGACPLNVALIANGLPGKKSP